jgi:hypothetical protein
MASRTCKVPVALRIGLPAFCLHDTSDAPRSDACLFATARDAAEMEMDTWGASKIRIMSDNPGSNYWRRLSNPLVQISRTK